MILLLVAALSGGFVTFAMLWTYGALVAIVGASFGGSLMALMAGVLLAFLRTRAEHNAKAVLDEPNTGDTTRVLAR